jgi:hypothetical protein
MRFAPENIKQGQVSRQEGIETADSFGTLDGAAIPRESNDLSKSGNRMAGKMGGRALSMINDPVEQQRTMNWMGKFGLSNQGMQWNQAKMMMSQPPAPQA